MNAIKYFSVLLMTILCLGMTACSNEDDEKKDKDDIENGKDDNNDKDDEEETVNIIGTWKYDDGDGWTLTYELKKNGTCKLTDTEIYNGVPDTSVDEGTYVYNKNTSILTLEFDNWTDKYKVLSISSTKLKVQWYDDKMDKYTDIYTLIKQ